MSQPLAPSLLSRSLAEFLDAVASDTEPVPAGACVAALTGAAGAGLVVLVARVLQRRSPPPNLADVQTEAERMQAQLRALIDADVAAYQAYAAARRLAHGAARNAALAGATRTPLEIAQACAGVARLARELARLGTGSIVSDAEVAARLAAAAAQAALDTAAHNLAALEPSPQREALISELDTIRSSV